MRFLLAQGLLAYVCVRPAWAEIHLTLYQGAPGQVSGRREFDLDPGADTLVWRRAAQRQIPARDGVVARTAAGRLADPAGVGAA